MTTKGSHRTTTFAEHMVTARRHAAPVTAGCTVHPTSPPILWNTIQSAATKQGATA